MTEKDRTASAFAGARSLHPLVVGHMCKQGIYPYILRMRLQHSTDGCLGPRKWYSISDLNSEWLESANYTGTPGEVAIAFRVGSESKVLELPN